MARIGILLSEDSAKELVISSGSIQIGETDLQNVDMIVSTSKGDIKEYPVLGVSPETYLKTVGKEKEFCREITVQLSIDGYNANATIDDGNLKIEV